MIDQMFLLFIPDTWQEIENTLIFLLVKGIWQKKHISSLGFLVVTDPLMWNTRKPHNELHLTQCHIDYEVGPIWIWIPYKKIGYRIFLKYSW